MQDYHHITNYNVDFNEYSAITGFDERALYANYYRGLAPRIKDGLVFAGRSGTLTDLRTSAINLDLRYWERYWERKDDKKSRVHRAPPKVPSGDVLSHVHFSRKIF